MPDHHPAIEDPPPDWWESVPGAIAVTYVAGFLAGGALAAQLMRPDGTFLMALGGSMLALGLAVANLRDARQQDRQR